MLDMYADNAVFDVSAVFTDVAPMEGHQDIRRYWGTLQETWKGMRIDPLEAFDVGERRFVVDQRMWATGQRSGIEVDQRFAMLYTVRQEDGKFVRAQLLPDLAAAISAAERTTPPEASEGATGDR